MTFLSKNISVNFGNEAALHPENTLAGAQSSNAFLERPTCLTYSHKRAISVVVKTEYFVFGYAPYPVTMQKDDQSDLRVSGSRASNACLEGYGAGRHSRREFAGEMNINTPYCAEGASVICLFQSCQARSPVLSPMRSLLTLPYKLKGSLQNLRDRN